MNELIAIFIGMALVNNIILFKFLGLCPFFGKTGRIRSAAGMGLVVSTVMFASSAVVWLISSYILMPLRIEYLSIVMYILVIVLVVQGAELLIRKVSGGLYGSLGMYLPLITANCAILGVILISSEQDYSFVENLVAALGAGVGFTLVLTIMAGIRERLELTSCPEAMKGLPVLFITAMLLGLAFYGFSGVG